MINLADVQLEHGFARIANEILDALAMKPLNGTQWRILIVVFRYTYGFCRREHELSEAFISKATGIHRKQVGRELNVLIKNNLLTVKKEASFSSSRVLAFNKDFELWRVSTKTLTGDVNAPVNELVGLTGNELVDPTGSGLVDQERKTKERLKKDELAKFFESIWKLYPNKKGKGQISDTQKAKLYKIGIVALSKCIERYKKSKQDWQAWQYGSTFFNSGYVDYLDANYQSNEEIKAGETQKPSESDPGFIEYCKALDEREQQQRGNQ